MKEEFSFTKLIPDEPNGRYLTDLEHRASFEVGYVLHAKVDVWHSVLVEESKYQGFFVGLLGGTTPIYGIIRLRKKWRPKFLGREKWTGEVIVNVMHDKDPQTALESILASQGRWIEFTKRDSSRPSIRYLTRRLDRFMGTNPREFTIARSGEEVQLRFTEVNP